MKLKDGEALFKQYAFLLQRSYEFGAENNFFASRVYRFIENNQEYNFYSYNRLEPILLHPYLLNSRQDQVIVMILNRESGKNGKPIEYIKFLSGKKEGGDWNFTLKKGFSLSFSYEGGNPILSDQEIVLRVLRNLIDTGLMENNSYKINDDFFSTF